MNVDQILTQYQSNQGVVSPLIATLVEQPQVRQQLYKAILVQPTLPFHGLLRHLLQMEVNFRNALETSDAKDEDDDYYGGIYKCAFLLSSCGDASDTLLLWKAKYINMDVGTSLGAEYFIGAGLEQTIQFLEHSGANEASDIIEYVQDWFSDPDALQWQNDWHEEQVDNIRGA